MAAGFQRFKELFFHDPTLPFSIDVSRIRFADGFFEEMEPRMQAAFDAMESLEDGAIANPDEQRMVGHYWLRNVHVAPKPELSRAISEAIFRCHQFAAEVHHGRVRPQRAAKFTNVLVIGIGGSALGPQFVASALTTPGDRLKPFFFDNTDPDGIDRTLDAIGEELPRTLAIVISKSGGTKETRNGMLEARAAYERFGLDFGRHAVAITGDGSELDRYAAEAGFLARFPMWDWVGGRTSVTSAVGLLPAALQGVQILALNGGAAMMDELTRRRETRQNPAALLALAWYSATGGVGKKDMVVLPYRDRLELFSRYLQQLVMESLGKELDVDGRKVNQGLAVYGNKGSTDQHAYVQQLREGIDNFFVTFIEVLKDRSRPSMEVEPGLTTGDYLFGFLQGTRSALSEAGRESITLTIGDVNAESVGALVALYERAVGLYASLIRVNAYHQPGVEAGKRAAAAVLALQQRVVAALKERGAAKLDELAKAAGTDDLELVFAILRRLAANPEKQVVREGDDPFAATWRFGR
jgi:glucose-6-phosphate isomerase